MTALTYLAYSVRKDDYGYPQYQQAPAAAAPKSRLPEAVTVGGAGLGIMGGLGVNNAIQLPKRTADAVRYHEGKFAVSRAKAKDAKAKAKGTSRMSPKKKGFERALASANAAAIRDANQIRANKHIIRNMSRTRLRGGISGGMFLAGGAGLAALGNSMRKKRDSYEPA